MILLKTTAIRNLGIEEIIGSCAKRSQHLSRSLKIFPKSFWQLDILDETPPPLKFLTESGVGNLGLQDRQRRPSAKFFAGSRNASHPSAETLPIYGAFSSEYVACSAGVISVSLQMLGTNSDNGLFRTGFMQSGAPIPVRPREKGQKYYDVIVQHTAAPNPQTLLHVYVPFHMRSSSRTGRFTLLRLISGLASSLGPAGERRVPHEYPGASSQEGKVGTVRGSDKLFGGELTVESFHAWSPIGL
ncbi:hypothetical protein DFH09DRAFT_1076186 [Mycena vulgaris]|nr:hypothetical protein DFH09DRAFT_1076186 [Mycena vulgaris]